MAGMAVMDIGKSNTKFSVLDTGSGTLVSAETCQTRTLDEPCYPLIDTKSLWDWLLNQIRQTAAQTRLSHICVTAHGATVAVVDDSQLVLPVLDYEYTGPDSLQQEYDQLCDDFTLTHSPRLPGGLNVGRQLYWQRANFPDEFQRAKHILPYPQYWSWLLTGLAATEVTTLGSHTDLWNPLQRDYSPFAKSQGFASLFAPMQTASDVLGNVQQNVIDATGINKDCRVLVGIHDSNASLVPWLKTRQDPFTVLSTGTWTILFAIGASLDALNPDRGCTANVNLHGEPVACARFMGGREFAAVAGDDFTEGDITDLDAVLSDNIFALPEFTDAGGPFPGQTGRLLAPREMTQGERYALASVYCALLSDVSLQLCASQGDIIVEGVFTKNRLYLQCLAALRPGQRVLASTDNTGTTLGTAMLASDSFTAPATRAVRGLPDDLQSRLAAYRDNWLKHASTSVNEATA